MLFRSKIRWMQFIQRDIKGAVRWIKSGPNEIDLFIMKHAVGSCSIADDIRNKFKKAFCIVT